MIVVNYGTECGCVANKPQLVVEFVGKDGENSGNQDLSPYALISSLGELAYKDVAEVEDLGTSIIVGGVILTSLLDVQAIKVEGDLINTTEASTIATNITNNAITAFSETLGALAYLDNVGTAQLDTTILLGGKILNSLLDIPQIITDGGIALNGQVTTVSNNLTNLITSLGALAYEDTVNITQLDTSIISGGFILESLIPPLTDYIFASPSTPQEEFILVGNANDNIHLDTNKITFKSIAGTAVNTISTENGVLNYTGGAHLFRNVDDGDYVSIGENAIVRSSDNKEVLWEGELDNYVLKSGDTMTGTLITTGIITKTFQTGHPTIPPTISSVFDGGPGGYSMALDFDNSEGTNKRLEWITGVNDDRLTWDSAPLAYLSDIPTANFILASPVTSQSAYIDVTGSIISHAQIYAETGFYNSKNLSNYSTLTNIAITTGPATDYSAGRLQLNLSKTDGTGTNWQGLIVRPEVLNNFTWTLPDKDGTFAMTNDLVDVKEVAGVMEFKVGGVLLMKLDNTGLYLKSGLEVYPNNF